MHRQTGRFALSNDGATVNCNDIAQLVAAQLRYCVDPFTRWPRCPSLLIGVFISFLRNGETPIDGFRRCFSQGYPTDRQLYVLPSLFVRSCKVARYGKALHAK